MLQNAYFLAEIGADTAENEQQFAEILPISRRVADRCPSVPRRGGRQQGPGEQRGPPLPGYWPRCFERRAPQPGGCDARFFLPRFFGTNWRKNCKVPATPDKYDSQTFQMC